MAKAYKLDKIIELSDNDQDFIKALALAFLEEVPEEAKLLERYVAEKNYDQTYKTAHKIKPTVDLFQLGILDDLIEVQDWGKFEKKSIDISAKLKVVLAALHAATQELQADFN